MRKIICIILLLTTIGGMSTSARGDRPRKETKSAASAAGGYKFDRLEATETSWDHTSIIYRITDAEGREVSVPASQITYTVRDQRSNPIAYGKGIFVDINDTKLESEENYSIAITAHIHKESITQSIYRKASPKKMVLQQYGTSFAYKVMRPKYSSPTDYEKLNVQAISMSVEAVVANCRDCSTVRITDNSPHTTLSDADSYSSFDQKINNMMDRGRKVQVMLRPTVTTKDGYYRYAESYFEVSPTRIQELHVGDATAAEPEVEE
ncbi:MAG: hypothetical protein JST83_02660 [Bacteroidetes bacterium]|nr:hypothetical protein [Bacteroidota bacterium]